MGLPYEAHVDAATAGQLYRIHVHPGQWGQDVERPARGLRVPPRDGFWERDTRVREFYGRHGRRPDGQRRSGPGGGDYLRMRLDAGRV